METEELYRSDLGGSLWVKNVQALASKGLKEVPPRYLRPASELGKVCKTESLEIPNSIEGYGQAFVLSEDQKLDWKDMLLFVQPASQRNLRFWPKNPASFRATLDSYSSQLERISLFLLRAMAKNLGLSPDVLASMFEEGIQGIRLNYYPPCKQANEVLGQTPHSDATGLTLLTQVNDVDGLQIKKNGKWLPIKTVPRAFIINVGDVIEVAQ